ncbi:MAG: methyltransferase domain-containing protein [Rickettsia endosymbiont of Ixodes persulcatus]|nr:methyltransferase domain-containing protein [Rickettsia endosymbiont of Ixodes persulcatus]MCZ6913814.1 methyltransferase domain-containing protein [Rickettsia endosymbiont of Ixodes persulcatus]
MANAFSSKKNTVDEEKYNLEVMLCKDCGVAQLRDVLDPNDLFLHYIYFSSYSDTMLLSAKALVDRIAPSLSRNAFVVEIGSNDGYLLKNYKRYDIQVLGIDPARNITKKSCAIGIPTSCDFFNKTLAEDLKNKKMQADLIHANNVMAHVPDINDFITGLKFLLKDTGYAIIEVPYLYDLVSNLQFDTIYHEHVYYFSVKPLKKLFAYYDLEIFDIERISIHGGSLRIFVGHRGKNIVKEVVNNLVEKEVHFGLYEEKKYKSFMENIYTLKVELINFLNNLKEKQKRIAAYGASAKGTTLLNWFGVGENTLDFIVDRNPDKKGLFTPGTSLEIKLPEALLEQKIEYALLLTWNFMEEILQQQQSFRDKGGKFIIPLPNVRTIV